MHLRKRADTIALPPLPTVVPPSGDFDGNDGSWSTFLVNINSDKEGLHGQDFKVLISTSSPVTLLPMRKGGCNAGCAAKRGVLPFDGKRVEGVEESVNWGHRGTRTVPLPYWNTQDYTGINTSIAGEWGITNVGLGRSSNLSPVIPELYAVKFISDNWFMGSFGLSAGEVGSSGATRPTFLSYSKDRGVIASPSYGYTAGASYRNNGGGVLGSLVLGGYDNSRIVGSGLSLQMPSSINNTLVVGVPSITYTPDKDVESNFFSFTANSSGFRATIDSTYPFLVLPDAICDELVSRFGLDYDKQADLYRVSNSSHERNLQQNGTVKIQIAASPKDSNDVTNIDLPYAAFDLQIGDDIGNNLTRYFPIRKSKNGVYVLGRTFLQEAYIIVDYEGANFTVAPASNPDSLPKPDLKIIYSASYDPETQASSSRGLAPGAIAGTVVGIVVAFAIAGIVSFCWWKKRKEKKDAAQNPYETSQIDPTIAGQEIKYRRVSELTGSDLPNSPKTPLTDYYTSDHKSVPPISEMSPESPPVEMYSPPPESASDVDSNVNRDYFTAGGKPLRRGAQRDRASSGPNTPGTPIAELAGDEGQFHTPGSHVDTVGPSDTSLSQNIDERLADHKKEVERPAHPAETTTVSEEAGFKSETKADAATAAERRPSHQRGLSDTTVASDSTAVSQPTPEEEARWAKEPRRPLSP